MVTDKRESRENQGQELDEILLVLSVLKGINIFGCLRRYDPGKGRSVTDLGEDLFFFTAEWMFLLTTL